MIKKTILLSSLLSLSLAFGCAEFKDSMKGWPYGKEEKKPKEKQAAETPKQAPETTAKESAPSTDTTTKSAPPATKKSGSESSGAVFGPK